MLIVTACCNIIALVRFSLLLTRESTDKFTELAKFELIKKE